ncbi:pantoate--beta-alanine ligase [Thiohalorhabdus methylotrophus]|uniref:Pantothenate synthetase n=1 Tax=Thiohalorhabdus methylotrophus TaxID=3242694 RepID=A0ABV4U1V8_9GAMM
MHSVHTVAQLHEVLADFRRAGDRVALVPTMGNLHAGHLALVERARELADRVVVSVFVNPAQFAPGEDFEEYPRTLEADRERLLEAGVDVLFAPRTGEMYPDGVGAVTVRVDRVTEGLCSGTRPDFFTGVATVVTKLLVAARPDWAVFGKKDYQQWVTVRRLVRNLLLDVEIEAVPVVREEDGLALSSRNRYLSSAHREMASGLYRALRTAVRTGENENLDARGVEREAWTMLEAAGLDPEYTEVRRRGDLETVTDLQGPRVLLAAAHLGGTRLIDNLEFGSPDRTLEDSGSCR